MMNPNAWELAKARQEELIREAEAHNAAQESRRNRSKPSLYATVMAQVGEKMVAVGEALQERYDETRRVEV